MKRRKFLIAGALGVITNLCGLTMRQLQPADPVQPTETLPPAPATLATASPEAARTAQATATSKATSTAAAPASGDLVFDEFNGAAGAPTRAIGADSGGQVAVSAGELCVTGTAPGENDPSVYDTLVIQRAEGQIAGARFKVAYGKETASIGLAAVDGEPLASIRRTTAERLGGQFACGAQVFPVLNLYSDCWYDFVAFLQPQGAAFAINDGAGLELVLVSEDGRAAAGRLGYWGAPGEDQGARIDQWYAPAPRYFPPALVSQPAAAVDFEADCGTNAAWVEARIARVDGSAGLRIRSIDPDNEYRVYLDGTNLKVDQVIDGSVTPITTQAVASAAVAASAASAGEDGGTKLAVRYNELTLTVYYNGALTSILNRKIGAAELLNGTKVGVYSTHPGNTFTDFIVRPVRLAVPEFLSSRLLAARQVMCLGDSLTNADLAYGYQNRLRKRLGDGWVTIDCGVSGQSTYQMLSRLPGHLQRYKPEVLVVLGGTNDLDHHIGAEGIKGNLRAIYQTARRAGIRVAAVTIPPRGGSQGWTPEKQAALESVNGWILGASAVDYRIDAYALLKDPAANCLRERYDGGDHIHLSGNGYYALADSIYQNVSWG